LHFYPAGGRGWCLTNKVPLRNREGKVVGLTGVSKDLQTASERSEDYSRVADIVKHIHQHYGDTLKVTELAEQSGLSSYQLEHRIRRIFQITVGQLIQKVRMEAAVKRLRDSEDPIADIALDCGYSDQSAFTRQFRQTTGLSPSEYRRTFRKG
jgi:AraC-like DNA-binding protein